MSYKLSVAIMAGLLMTSDLVAEDSIPLNAVNRANEVIDAAIEAYGGSEAISGLKTISQQTMVTGWATNQSRVPGPPWDESKTQIFQAIDFENQAFVRQNSGAQGGFVFDGGVIIKGQEGWNMDYRAGTVTSMAEPDFNNTTGPFIRVTAPLLVKQLQERRQTSHWLGSAEVDGSVHDIITLVMEVGPALSLYIDRETHLITRSERVLPPFGQVDYRFSDYELTGGIPFARTFKLYVNDEPNLLIDRSNFQVNMPIDQYAAVPSDLERLEGVAQPDEIQSSEIEEGVFLVGTGGTYALFVEMDDHIIGVGGTAGIPDRIVKLREFSDKPIKFAVLTHHHNDHLVGVRAWEQEGAVIYTVKQHEQVVRGNAEKGDDLPLEFVDQRHVFEAGRRLEIVDIGPTPHSEHLLVAYLPEEGLIFEADHFPNPANGHMVPAQPVTERLAAAISEKELNVRNIVGAHSPRVASIEDLRKALRLKAEPKTAGL